MDAPPCLNRTWALAFMHDMHYDGWRFRTLHVRDEGNRTGLAIEVGTSLTGARIVAVLAQLVAIHGAPRALRCYTGPELLSRALTDWCARRGVLVQHIQPRKPHRNACIARFTRAYRRAVLDASVLASLAQGRAETTRWLTTYNTERPHDSLGGGRPLTLLPRPSAPSLSDHPLSA
jgi:putative transposase